MHYSVYVFIPPEGDIEEQVAEALRLYSDEHEVPPYKEYLDSGEIAAMARHYCLKQGDRKALAMRMDDWRGCPGGVDAEGLFSVKTWNPKAKWDWYEIGGRWSRQLPGNVISAKALLEKPNLKELLPAAMVTPDGWWHEWETFIVEGWMKWRTERKKDGTWLRELKSALLAHSDLRVVCVDIHR
jgi:hypothetical protein